MSVVDVQVSDTITLSAILLETPETAEYLQLNHPITLLFKETEVVLGLEKHLKISIQNCILAKVLNTEKGKLLGRVELESTAGKLTAVLSAKAMDTLSISEGMDIYAYVKLNEIMLAAE